MRIEQTLRIGHMMTQELATTNRTAVPFALTEAFHTYFRVGDAEKIGITGLAGLTYLDKPSDFAKRIQTTPFHLEGECDRIYLDTQGEFSIEDPVFGRRTACVQAAADRWSYGIRMPRRSRRLPTFPMTAGEVTFVWRSRMLGATW